MEKLELVLWRDAWFDFDQSNDDREDYIVKTVGWVIHEGPHYLSVAQEKLPIDDGWRAVTHIPVAVIIDRMEVTSNGRANTNRSASTPTGSAREPVA